MPWKSVSYNELILPGGTLGLVKRQLRVIDLEVVRDTKVFISERSEELK
jgi:hypothetical protein